MANLTDTSLEFWKTEIWGKRNIGFHMDQRHPMLVKHKEVLINGRQKCKILFPLCGKAVDMLWFASIGHEIIGIECVPIAIEEFFNENKLEYTTRDVGEFKVFESNDKLIRLYCGDLFKFNSSYESGINAVWDRGSLVAIQVDTRKAYADLMLDLSSHDCIYLLDAFDYDPEEHPGPPHFVSADLVNELFSSRMSIEIIDRKVNEEMTKRLNLKTPLTERVTLMKFVEKN